MPPWSSGSDAGFSARKRGFESRRGFFQLAVGETVTPPVSGTGDRWFDSSRPDLRTCATRGGGAAFLASLMSSRRGFESHPRNVGGVAQRPEHSLVRRMAAGSSPVVPVRGGRGVTASIRGRDPRGTGSSPVGRPFHADAEHRRAQRAVTPSPPAVVVRLHPSALPIPAKRRPKR